MGGFTCGENKGDPLTLQGEHGIYAAGKTPYHLSDLPALPHQEQIARLAREIWEADCILVGGASGLSAAGGGDFYCEDNASYRQCARPCHGALYPVLKLSEAKAETGRDGRVPSVLVLTVPGAVAPWKFT